LVQDDALGDAGQHLADVRELPRPDGRLPGRITIAGGRGGRVSRERSTSGRPGGGAPGENRLDAVEHDLGTLRPPGVALAEEVRREREERGRRVQGQVAAGGRRRPSRVAV